MNNRESTEAASALVNSDQTNPCRRLFGVGHAITATGISILSVPAAFLTLPKFLPVTPGVATIAYVIGCGIVGAAVRNQDYRDIVSMHEAKQPRSIAVEFALFAASQGSVARNAVHRSFLGGLWNGLKKNAVVYSIQAPIVFISLAAANIKSGKNYFTDTVRALLLDRAGNDPSTSTTKTFQGYLAPRVDKLMEWLHCRGIVTDRDASSTIKRIASVVKHSAATNLIASPRG